MLRLLDRLGYARADGVLDAHDAEEDEVLEDGRELDGAVLDISAERWPLLVVAVDDADGAERLAGVAVDGLEELVLLGPAQAGDGEVGDVGLGGAVAQEDLGGALDQEPAPAVAQLDDRPHALLARVEGEHLHDLLVGARLGQRLHAQVVLGQLQQGSLGLGPDEGELALVLALEGGRVDGDGLDDGLLGCRGQAGRPLGDRHGGLVALGLGEAGGSERAGDDRHLVGGEGAGLVGAYGRGVTHGLTGAEHPHEVVLLEHAGGCEGQGECHGQWETLWDSNDDNSDGDDQDVLG